MSTKTLGPRGIARRTDPATSHAAAASVAPKAPRVRERVLEILHEHGPLTLDALIGKHRSAEVFKGWPPASDSSIRTRCSELVRDGLAEPVSDDVGQSSMGHPARLFRAAIVQNNETDGQAP